MNDRMPPFNEDAEKSVLGSILIDGIQIVDLCLEYQLQPKSFYVPAHRIIFECLIEMSEKLRPIDSITVGNELKKSGKLDSIGGSIALDRLIDSTPTGAHAEYYIDIVASDWKSREMIDQCRTTEARCFERSEEDISTIIAEHAIAMTQIEDHSKHDEIPWRQIVQEAMASTERIIAGDDDMVGLPTGFKNLDSAMLGLKPGEMTILAARPSQGKTSLCMNIAENISMGVYNEDPLPVGVFSLEMGREQLALRMKCSRAKVSYWDLVRGFTPKTDYAKLTNAAGQLMNALLHVDDTGGLDIKQLRFRARRWKKRFDIQLLIVDYLQLLHDAEKQKHGRQIEVSSVSSHLKECAKELDIPILALAQLSRQTEMKGRDGIPKLSDLRESGSLENDADNVLLMRRPCKYPKDDEYEDKTLAIIDVAKQRNGPTGFARLNFLEQFTRFEDRSHGTETEEMEYTDE